MAEAYSVLDGSQLRKALPELATRASKRIVELDVEGKGGLTGQQARAAAESEAAVVLLGAELSKQQFDKAFQGITSHDGELDEETFRATVEKYLQALADSLQEGPVVISVLDGSVIRGLLEDEDEFAMLSENLFTEFDKDDNGKLSRSELRPAILQLGVEMGVPTPSATPEAEPLLSELFKRYRLDEAQELGQTQFAKVLQEILQDLEKLLQAKPVVVVHDLMVVNGSRLRKVLADDKLLSEVAETIFQELDVNEDGKLDKVEVRPILESKGIEWGLPPHQADGSTEQLFDEIFSIVDADNSGEIDRSEFQVLLKAVFENFAQQLELNPIIVDTESAYRP
eukprot:TRINITY_DN11505_c0_g1_i1.p1 TRINITY_DN11505_c0_g1~~TRINITY_DN11505_c0_g1_i1.p1  ORF type:complete len:340 (-),score=91.07 TRINITY_DN11505_c0_g1_i1:562-1581(-)